MKNHVTENAFLLACHYAIEPNVSSIHDYGKGLFILFLFGQIIHRLII